MTDVTDDLRALAGMIDDLDQTIKAHEQADCISVEISLNDAKAILSELKTPRHREASIAPYVEALRRARRTLAMPTPPIDLDKTTVAGAAMWEGERKQMIAQIDALLPDTKEEDDARNCSQLPASGTGKPS